MKISRLVNAHHLLSSLSFFSFLALSPERSYGFQSSDNPTETIDERQRFVIAAGYISNSRECIRAKKECVRHKIQPFAVRLRIVINSFSPNDYFTRQSKSVNYEKAICFTG
jgi:hypothetical protein